MLAHLTTALADLLTDPISIAVVVTALLGGLVFGAIPGLSGITLATIVLPFSAYLEPQNAIAFFGVLYVSGVYGGAVTAILFNIPGSAENAPTAFDGYPLTRQGKAGKAIGTAIICSGIGGTASCIIMMIATVPIADWAIKAFGPPEIFSVIVFGLVVASQVGAATPLKGFISVIVGLLIATVGTEPATGAPRFDFGSTYLMAGIHFVPLILGFFAITEVFVQGHLMVSNMKVPARIGVSFPTFFEIWALKITILRSTAIGFFAGILPGIGATLAAFLSYNEAVRWSRTPSRFGKGELAGVAASETANNAATGAAMIPLLALGLPGGALTAIMVSALQIHGLEPGPIILVTHSSLVWTVFAAMLIANLSIVGLGLLESKLLPNLLRIPFSILGPLILLMSTVGAFALRNLVLDVWVIFIAGLAGYVMRRTGYSMAGVVLGVILGDIGEGMFVRSMQLFNYDATGFLHRPVSATLLALTLVSIAMSAYLWLHKKPETEEA